ncbi:hypothetical protein [Roseixanthobacter pseudopolyaromaticivorans]|uniref:hypothetical protein n=1 Tax=Xanthobacteraceae TaxID=335928 RepID=UPI00372C4BC5
MSYILTSDDDAFIKGALAHGQFTIPQIALNLIMSHAGGDSGRALFLCKEALIHAMTPLGNPAFQPLLKVGAFLEEGKPLV